MTIAQDTYEHMW